MAVKQIQTASFFYERFLQDSEKNLKVEKTEKNHHKYKKVTGRGKTNCDCENFVKRHLQGTFCLFGTLILYLSF